MSWRLLTSIAFTLLLGAGIAISMRDTASGGVPACVTDDDGDLYCAETNDCDDNDFFVNPGATEVCDNSIDDDCDGDADLDDADCDMDDDGWSPPEDCDDTNADVNPDATEVCDNSIDDDCNGDVDAADARCQDGDGDGFTPDGGDCDDADASVHPLATEVDDDVDNNCNGIIDELIGGRVIATGGPVTVSLTPTGAGFDSDLWFFGPGTPFKIGSNRESTSGIAIGSFDAGTELRFALVVHNNIENTDDRFSTGPGCRNLDGTEHAAHLVQSPTELQIGFEDLRGGGDLNYADGVMTVSGATHDPDAGICALNHFMCYAIKATKGNVCANEAPSNAGVPCEDEEDCGGTTDETDFCVRNKIPLGPKLLHLDDFLEAKNFDVKKPAALCNPAAKTVGDEFTGIDDSHTHLEAHAIVQAKNQAKFVKQTGVNVNNQFGDIVLDLVKAERLLVPTSKSHVSLQPEPNPLFHQVSHFKCYKAAATKGAAKFVPRAVNVVDQFNQPKLFDIKKPTRFCRPVDKAGEGTIVDPSQRLLCYQAKAAKGAPKHAKETGLFINNQFGPEQVDTTKETELCVPSSEGSPA